MRLIARGVIMNRGQLESNATLIQIIGWSFVISAFISRYVTRDYNICLNIIVFFLLQRYWCAFYGVLSLWHFPIVNRRHA